MSWFTEMESFMADTDDYRESVESDLLESDTSTQNTQWPPTPPTSTSTPIRPTPTPPLSISQTEQSRSSDDYSGRRNKKKKIGEPAGVAEALSRLQNISSAINNRNEEDEFSFFGLNVVSQLRQLPLYEALGVQTEIQAILTAARRRNMYSNLSAPVLPISNTQTYTYSSSNIQPITSTLPASNTQTNAMQSSNIQPITSTLPASNTQTNAIQSSNVQPITSTLPASNTQTNAIQSSNIQPITSTLLMSNTQTNAIQSSNIQPINHSTLPASNTQAYTLSYSNIQPVTCTSNYTTLCPSIIQNDTDENEGNAQSQQGRDQVDLLSEAWKLS